MTALAWELVCMVGLCVFVVGYLIVMFACLVEFPDEMAGRRNSADDNRVGDRPVRMVATDAVGGVAP